MKTKNIVRKYRKGKNWSQANLAEVAGISDRSVQRVERGEVVSVDTLHALAVAFEVDYEDLLPPSPFPGVSKVIAQARVRILIACYAENSDTWLGWRVDGDHPGGKVYLNAVEWLEYKGYAESIIGKDHQEFWATITPAGRDFVESHTGDSE